MVVEVKTRKQKIMRTVKLGIVAVGLLSASMVSAQEKEVNGARKDNGNKLFEKLDANSDGVISKAEFIAGREGKTNQKGEAVDLDKHFAKKDTNGDGNIDRAEFDKAREDRQEHALNRPKGDGHKHFESMDTDANGLISKEEFTAKHAGKTNKDGKPFDVDKRFSKLDANGDGNIDKVEMKAAHDHKEGHEGHGDHKDHDEKKSE
jgi:Ca2+-binding EF-hand superfamily protein